MDPARPAIHLKANWRGSNSIPLFSGDGGRDGGNRRREEDGKGDGRGGIIKRLLAGEK